MMNLYQKPLNKQNLCQRLIRDTLDWNFLSSLPLMVPMTQCEVAVQKLSEVEVMMKALGVKEVEVNLLKPHAQSRARRRAC